MQTLKEQITKDQTTDQVSGQLPIDLKAELENGPSNLHCTARLRFLPGKRTVYDAIESGQRVIVKAFFGPGKEKYFAREIAGLKALATAGLPAPALQNSGESADGQTKLLVLEYLEETTSLASLLETTDSGAKQLNVLRNPVTTIARMHAQGIIQQDIHPDNFLVRDETCYVIDGASIDAVERSSSNQRLDNLALFCAQIALIDCPLTDRLHSLYTDSLGADSGFSAQQLWQKVVAKQRYRNLKFLKKIYRDCTQVKVRSSWHRLVACTRGYDSPGLNRLLENPDAYIDEGKLLKDGNSSTVALVTLDDTDYVVKRYNIKNFNHRLSRCWRESRASISWRNTNLLQLLGIATPAPIALMEKRWGPLRSTSYFISEHIRAQDLRTLFADQELTEEKRAQVAEQLRSLLQKLERAEISHGDFKATNFLVTDDKLVLIDLDATKWHRNPRRFREARGKDLARFMANWEKDGENFRYFSEIIGDIER